MADPSDGAPTEQPPTPAEPVKTLYEQFSQAVAQGRTLTEEDLRTRGAQLGVDADAAHDVWEVIQRQQARRRRRLRNNRTLLLGSASFVVIGIVVVGTWRALVPSQAVASQGSFQGTWETSRGRLELVSLRVSDSIEGRYSYTSAGRLQAGVLKGVVRGNTLVATWEEQRPDGRHQGPAQFELAPNGQSFQGAWGDHQPPDPDGAWSGTRVVRTP